MKKLLSKEELSEMTRRLAKFRWKNTPKWKRRLHVKKMNEARAKKKSTSEVLRKSEEV